MPNSPTNISDWKKRWQIDYFSLFTPLWLSFNAWFKDWGVAKGLPVKTNERNYIIKLKESCDGSNKIFSKFDNYISSNNLRGDNFRTHLANLHSSLESIVLLGSWGDRISFKNAWISWDGTGKVFKSLVTEKKRNILRLTNEISFIDSKEDIFRALIENIYQIRCMLMHGDLEASAGHHRVIQYAYLVLNDLTEDF